MAHIKPRQFKKNCKSAMEILINLFGCDRNDFSGVLILFPVLTFIVYGIIYGDDKI